MLTTIHESLRDTVITHRHILALEQDLREASWHPLRDHPFPIGRAMGSADLSAFRSSRAWAAQELRASTICHCITAHRVWTHRRDMARRKPKGPSKRYGHSSHEWCIVWLHIIDS